MYDIINIHKTTKNVAETTNLLINVLDRKNFYVSNPKENYIEFTGNIIGFGWQLSPYISHGNIEVIKTFEENYIICKISIRRVRLMMLFFIILAIVGPYLGGAPIMSFFFLPVALIISPWIYFVILLFVKNRFKNIIKKVLLQCAE